MEYDPFAWSVLRDPYPFYKALRDHDSVYHNTDRDFWALARFDEVQMAARDWKTYSSANGVELDDQRTLFRDLVGRGVFIMSDPPDHDRVRKVVQPWFTPRALAVLENEVRQRARTLILDLRERDDVDLAVDFGWRLPIQLISALLGFPPSDESQLLQWMFDLEDRSDDLYEIPEIARRAVSELAAYIDERLRLVGEDDETLLGVIAAGGAAATLDPDELRGVAFQVFIAATDTIAGLVTNALHLLESRPAEWQQMGNMPETLPACVEELVRYEAPVQGLARVTTRAVEIRGTTIPANSWVWLLFGSANRDERRFERPDVLDFSRRQRNLGFGEGIHHCLGAPLARLEARVAFEELFTKLHEYELLPGAERLRQHVGRGWLRLPARLEWSASATGDGTTQQRTQCGDE